MTDPWLVLVDLQRVFGAPDSPCVAPRVVLTRFVAPDRPAGAWGPYHERFPFALVPSGDPI